MPVQHIHTFLVHPGKGAHGKASVSGTSVPLSGKMFGLLNDIYTRSDSECDIDITFRPRIDGAQQNDCRDLILDYLGTPGIPAGRKIANRLSDTTDGRSGLGLLFLISGKEGPKHKIIVSRFPTDSAIYVDEKSAAFTVEFLERVFMKNKTSYKAVAYQDQSLRGDFWTGRAIDKQLNNQAAPSSDYWINEFLASEFSLTPAAGTRRLAQAIRDAAKKSPLNVKQELVAAATLASGLTSQRVSIDTFMDQFNLSQAAREAIKGVLKRQSASQEIFRFDNVEFRSLIAHRSVELDNGALLTADASDFDDIFHLTRLHGKKDEVEFSTKGKIVDDKLKTSLR